MTNKICKCMGLLLLATCAGAVAAEVGSVVIATPDGPLTCYFHDAEYLPSRRIWVFGGVAEQVTTDEAWFVGQGYGGPTRSLVEGMPQADLAARLYSTLQFELTMDGSRVVPDYIVIWPATLGDGREVWGCRRHYEFAPGQLVPGIYVLGGKWEIVDCPCAWDPEACTSAEYLENPRYTFDLAQGTFSTTPTFRTLTLTVVYP